MNEKNWLGLQHGRRKAELREAMELLETDAGWNLGGKPQSRGNTQINRNGSN